MDREMVEAIGKLADLTASLIRRAGASYGSPDQWRADFTAAVKVSEWASRNISTGEVYLIGHCAHGDVPELCCNKHALDCNCSLCVRGLSERD